MVARDGLAVYENYTTGEVTMSGYRICIWIGIVGVLLFAVGIWPIAHLIPPIAPSQSADAVAVIYAEGALSIRVGIMIAMFGAAMLCPYFAVLSVLIKRIEGGNAPLAMTVAISAAIVIACFFLGLLFLTVAAFRPDRAPELTQFMNDFAWLMIVTPAAPGVVMLLCSGMAILGDSAVEPLLPRWVGYMCFWVGVLLIPGALAILFKTGPFAWDGILAFWMPFGAFFIAVLVLAMQMLKTTSRTDT
jgi:hypothetical protein